MTLEVQRRGMIRLISDLPAFGTPNTPLVEVEDGGKFYKAAYAAGGASYPPFANNVAFSAPLATAFTDVAKGRSFKTAGTAPTFAGGKMVLGGAGCVFYNTLQFDSNGEDMQLEDMPYTLEGWFSSSTTTTNAIVVDTNTSNQGGYTVVLNLNGTVGELAWLLNPGSGAVVTCTVLGITNDGTRHHIAIVHVSPLLTYLFIDGVRVGQSNATSSLLGKLTSNVFALGGRISGGSFAAPGSFSLGLTGTLDNWRFTKGIALYPGINFTVPTPPFPTS